MVHPSANLNEIACNHLQRWTEKTHFKMKLKVYRREMKTTTELKRVIVCVCVCAIIHSKKYRSLNKLCAFVSLTLQLSLCHPTQGPRICFCWFRLCLIYHFVWRNENLNFFSIEFKLNGMFTVIILLAIWEVVRFWIFGSGSQLICVLFTFVCWCCCWC